MATFMPLPSMLVAFILFSAHAPSSQAYRIWLPQNPSPHEAASFMQRHQHPHNDSGSKRFEGSSPFVHMQYHMGPVLTSSIRVYIIWYGRWTSTQKATIRDFLRSFSMGPAHRRPTVGGWWNTVQLYTDQTGSNISKSVMVAGEAYDHFSHGTILSRMSVQEVIRDSIKNGSLVVDSNGGLYMVLTSKEVQMQDFCRAVCGFHYFTFPSIVGYTLPYAWIGNSAQQCPQFCAYPFAVPSYMIGFAPLKPPNRDVGVDGMISVIGHELAELSSNPLINAWYAGNDPSAPTEIADLCEGIYGSGGGGSYMGSVLLDGSGASYNMHGVKKRRYLVQWIWNPSVSYCTGPNAAD
ncbi:hypothetical protein GOP47_0018701 [Adiantum capillus-veneris]|uniref:Uncharacterized protein n=1 Tax=Adiantum capillus-veneris TaxID=13818 RepID=A0A9D4UE75_ADICA|nr:hypothetical protein GOP47_0018701 [Adiantum capillus-veneris]